LISGTERNKAPSTKPLDAYYSNPCFCFSNKTK